MKKQLVILTATMLSTYGTSAMAFDATGATGHIAGETTTGIAALGAAFLLLAASAVAFKWAKRMVFDTSNQPTIDHGLNNDFIGYTKYHKRGR